MIQDVFIFLGPPGAGKGSLSRLCVKNLGWKQLSTGDLCRKHIQEATLLGKEIDFAIKSGKLVSDSLITEMVIDWLKNQHNGTPVIFDGFPRTLAQAESLEQIIRKTLPSLKLHVVCFDLDDGVIINRLINRFICTNKNCQAVYSILNKDLSPKLTMTCDECGSHLGRRKDDELEAIKERLKIYHEHKQSLLDFYNVHGRKIFKVAVNTSLPQVFDAFQHVVQEAL